MTKNTAGTESPELEEYVAQEIKIFDQDDPHQQRLYAALFTAQCRLLALQGKADSSAEAKLSFEVAKHCYSEAYKKAQEKNGTYNAWGCLHEFDDVLIDTMEGDELEAYWCMLCTESEEKLSRWRATDRARMVKLIENGKGFSKANVRMLHDYLATVAQDSYYKIAVFEKQTLPKVLELLELVILIALVSVLTVISIWEISSECYSWAMALLLAIGAGGLGGVLSMSISVAQEDLATRIPRARIAGPRMTIRPFLGAVVAIPILVLTKTDLVTVKGLQGNFAIFAFCFLGGISERWFLDLLGRFESATVSANKSDTEAYLPTRWRADASASENSLTKDGNRVAQDDAVPALGAADK